MDIHIYIEISNPDLPKERFNYCRTTKTQKNADISEAKEEVIKFMDRMAKSLTETKGD